MTDATTPEQPRTTRRKYLCPFCPEWFWSQEDQSRHRNGIHATTPEQPRTAAALPECPVCGDPWTDHAGGMETWPEAQARPAVAPAIEWCDCDNPAGWHTHDTTSKPDPAVASTWCEIHQHYKACEHNGGTLGASGYEWADRPVVASEGQTPQEFWRSVGEEAQRRGDWPAAPPVASEGLRAALEAWALRFLAGLSFNEPALREQGWAERRAPDVAESIMAALAADDAGSVGANTMDPYCGCESEGHDGPCADAERQGES